MLPGRFQGFAWVTIVFALIDRSTVTHLPWPDSGKEWTIEDLEEEYENRGRRVDTAEPVVSINFHLIFVGVLSGFAGYIGWYTHRDGIWSITHLLEGDVLAAYFPFLIALGAVNILLAILMLIRQKWS